MRKREMTLDPEPVPVNHQNSPVIPPALPYFLAHLTLHFIDSPPKATSNPRRVSCECPSVMPLAHLLVAIFHSLIVLSALPEPSVLPSGLNTTEVTLFVCPLRVICSLPIATSHNGYAIAAPRGQRLAVRTEYYGQNPVLVPHESNLFLSVMHVPQLDRLIFAPRGQRLAIWTECRRPHIVRVPHKGEQ